MPRLDQTIDVPFVNRTFFPNDKDPSAINKGRCFLWAYIAFRLYKGVELWSFGSHAFVKQGDRFYDSVSPKGERDWKNLPACNFGRGCGCPHCVTTEQVSPKTFKSREYWGKNARNRNIVWKDVREQVQRVV
ncbi:MAG: hypothetical protein ACRDHW_17085, partial [Ktedonobacteraceae bacterium]